MNRKKKQSIVNLGILRQFILLLALLVALGTAIANELKSSSHYSMDSSVDHLYFKLLIADLNGRDDWVTKGEVKAYSEYGRKGTSYTLFNVWTVDQSNTEYHRIYGKVEQTGALAKYVGTYSSGMDHLTNGDDATYVRIEDSDHYFPMPVSTSTGRRCGRQGRCVRDRIGAA